MDGSRAVNEALRRLPAVERLIESAADGARLQRWSLLTAARAILAQVRGEIRSGAPGAEADPAALAEQTRALARQLERPHPRRVINATGVVLHTNLGRAPLAAEAARAAVEAAGYSDLELDLETGGRGSRLASVAALLRALTGAGAATVVNNNAAAVLLAVDALAAGRDVVISRGELVEIGGSFRIPDILAASRARLVEVGTTNRTHPADYERAIGPETGALLKVHRSNFELRGFTADVSARELAPLARARGVPLIEDRGSGTFLDLRAHGLPEPCAHESLADGADLVTFSGDKLLGGPQAGIVLGRAELVERMRTSPLARALRVDKLNLAALHWTLRALLEQRGPERLPVLRMLLAPAAELEARARRLARALEPLVDGTVGVELRSARVGGGSLPEVEMPGPVVRVEPRGSASALAARLRAGAPPVIARLQRGAVLLDPRTLTDAEVDEVAAAWSRTGAPID